jgi:hypothetical protein
MDAAFDDSRKAHRPSSKKIEKHKKIDAKKRGIEERRERNPKVHLCSPCLS